MENKDKKLTDEEKRLQDELEKLEIIQKSNEPKTQINIIDEQGGLQTLDERKEIISSDTDDPDKKYAVYYKDIERMLKMVINPRRADKATKEAFKILREEKNILLTQGKMKNQKGIRGRDARMGYVRDMEFAANIIADNILKGGNPLELYFAFRDKNIELGYYDNLKKDIKSLGLQNDDRIRDIMNAIKSKENNRIF
jgi:HD superfamily phosphohydrolase